MARADISDDGLWLVIECSRAENGLCSQIPGMNYRERDNCWRVPLSWPAYVAFRTVWASQPVDESPDLAAFGANGWLSAQYSLGMRSQLDAAPGIWDELCKIESDEQMTGPNGTSLFEPQRGGAQWLVAQERTILADPQGSGKSPQAIRALQILELRGQGSPALIIAPSASLLHWRDKLAQWAPELAVQVVAGTAAARQKALRPETAEGTDALAPWADVYLVAWDNIRLHSRLAAYPGKSFVRCPDHGGEDPAIKPSRCEVHEKELNQIPFAVVIADEAHRMATAKNKWTRAVWHLAHSSRFFWALTGTPIGDTVEDLWPILHAISPKAWPAKSRYLDLFAVQQYSFAGGGKTVLGLRADHASAFHACTQPLIRAIPKEISRPYWPGRVPPVFRYPPMMPAQKRIYDQLRKDLLADLPDGHTMIPAKPIAVFSRLYQAASASIETRDGEDEHGFTVEEPRLCLPSSKADDLMDFLEDEPGQVVVAAQGTQLIGLCECKLAEAKITHARITGGMSHDDQYMAARWFQDGQVRVIFITKAGAESIDLFASDVIYFIQPEPSYLIRDQKIGRLDRIGQTRPVRTVYSITPGTVEERLFQLGEDKEERAGEVMSDATWMRWVVTGDGEAPVQAA